MNSPCIVIYIFILFLISLPELHGFRLSTITRTSPTIRSLSLHATSIFSPVEALPSPIKKHPNPAGTFFDTCKLNVTPGPGGSGCTAFLRTKDTPHGGPSGGSGGSGGSVYLVARAGVNSFESLRGKVHHRGKKGLNGKGAGRHGKGGEDVVVEVPIGTVVKDQRGRHVVGEGGASVGR